MKHIKYKVPAVNMVYNAETDMVEEVATFGEVSMPYTEANEEIAKREAYNGEYTIEDDGQPDPEQPSETSVWDELDAAYQEGVDSV